MDNITVIVPASPIPSHPDTKILDETIDSVRVHLPDSEIIITFDGVHPTYEKFTESYNEHKTKVLWKCLHEWTNVLPVVFDEHQHQSGMMHAVMDEIRTPLILYVEQDAPLTPDREIDWDECAEFIKDGHANVIRFHFEEIIPEPHKSLMMEQQGNFLQTVQWSQRPHLSSKVYYEQLLKYFPDDAKTFIEDEWHGAVYNDYQKDGMLGWYKHRLWIYYPDDSIGIKRSYTTDGRQGIPKVGEGFEK